MADDNVEAEAQCCCVCLETRDDDDDDDDDRVFVPLDCLHDICRRCLVAWKTPACPMCRADTRSARARAGIAPVRIRVFIAPPSNMNLAEHFRFQLLRSMLATTDAEREDADRWLCWYIAGMAIGLVFFLLVLPIIAGATHV